MTSHHERVPSGARRASTPTVVQSSDEVVTPATTSPCEPADRDHILLHQADVLLSRVGDELLPGHTAAESLALTRVARWAEEFLANAHPALGRPGHVCPYVAAALRDQRFLLTVLRKADENPESADEAILHLGRHFLQLPPTERRLAQRKTIVVLFPDLPPARAGEIIDAMHRRLKPHFLREGMMLGEFHQNSSKPGLHNPDFRPLRSEIPLLVIRTMVLTDIAFLNDEARFIRAFLAVFGARGAAEILSYVDCQQARLSAQQITMLLDHAFEAGATRPPIPTT